jgi:hypothetical protein
MLAPDDVSKVSQAPAELEHLVAAWEKSIQVRIFRN